MTFKELVEAYQDVDSIALNLRQLETLKEGLSNVDSEEIFSLFDGQCYIDLLRKFREAIAEIDKLNGKNYPQLLRSILSVGEDGLYSNSLRFIYELIQNVDDCSYSDPKDCTLDMDFNTENGEIALSYNENGFSPFNVFAITGIAEAAKNTENLQSIGEKGIGFKSVFGIADKVHIHSGWFSFVLEKESFTIPIPVYEEIEFCPGTEMILYSSPEKVKEIYNQLETEYCKEDAIFTKNPILFLKQLSDLRIFDNLDRSMEFHVQRIDKKSLKDNEILREKKIEICVELHASENEEIRNRIYCVRYTLPVCYSEEACQSRCDNNIIGKNGGEKMMFQLVIPHVEFLRNVSKGTLYSFLPTQTRLTVPVACHVPFKLDASREFVDPQNNNLWFKESCLSLSRLFDSALSDWKNKIKTNMPYYLPGAKESIFKKRNEKESCLTRQGQFSGEYFLSKPYFYIVNESFRKNNEIFCFDKSENAVEPETAAKILNYEKKLFFLPSDINPQKFNIEICSNVQNKIFDVAMRKPNRTKIALDYLDKVDYEYTERKFLEFSNTSFTEEQVLEFIRHKKLLNIIQSTLCDKIRDFKQPGFTLKARTIDLNTVMYDGFEVSDTPKQVQKYLSRIEKKCVCIDFNDDIVLPFNNVLAISRSNPVGSLAQLCRFVNSKDVFAIRIQLNEASKRLNEITDNEIGTVSDYLRELKNKRRFVKDVLGTNGYRSYINLILKSGTDSGRFIQELLQNADDCEYPKDVIPSFKLNRTKFGIVTEYNEKGFSRSNVRSITAIGESTKNKLLNGEHLSIGEKGIGFKTIFAVASNVKIFSGEFKFSLTDKEPTIPNIIEQPTDNVNGTKMEISLKDDSIFPDYSEKEILDLCLCLRRLKRITIGKHNVFIEDNGLFRKIIVNNKEHLFKKYIHSFEIIDQGAINEISNGNRSIAKRQSIVIYVPDKNKKTTYFLYNGLPTKHEIKIPLVIDAPFELTTSREQIETDCVRWNNIIRGMMYDAILNVMLSCREEDRLDILRFVRYLPYCGAANYVRRKRQIIFLCSNSLTAA